MLETMRVIYLLILVVAMIVGFARGNPKKPTVPQTPRPTIQIPGEATGFVIRPPPRPTPAPPIRLHISAAIQNAVSLTAVARTKMRSLSI
jgi:hypothetical protein